jgi:ribonuclease HI
VDTIVAREGANGVVGAICRDDHEKFVVVSVRVIPRITEPEALEAIACSEALTLAEDIGIDKMNVVSDCLNVIRNIDEMSRCPYMMFLQEIHEKTKAFDCVQFVHEGRECNREAHVLAKYACTLRVG